MFVMSLMMLMSLSMMIDSFLLLISMMSLHTVIYSSNNTFDTSMTVRKVSLFVCWIVKSTINCVKILLIVSYFGILGSFGCSCNFGINFCFDGIFFLLCLICFYCIVRWFLDLSMVIMIDFRSPIITFKIISTEFNSCSPLDLNSRNSS